MDAVRERFADATDGKAVKRLVVAREYLAGRSPSAIEAKYGVPEQTVYDWLDRIEERGLDDALVDDTPPGRQPTLTHEQRREFSRAVDAPPSESGFDSAEWTSTLARQYLRESFGAEFTDRHVRRLLAELGTNRTS